MIKLLTDLTEKELSGKKVLLRVDFNVPVLDGEISEYYRIKAVQETIEYLLNRNAIVAVLSHITAIKSFEPIFVKIKETIGKDLKFLSDCIGNAVKENLSKANPGDIFLLENVRQYDGEENNDEKFAEKLAEPFDIYVNDAFAASHRNHASIVSVTKFLPSYGGTLLMKELKNLKKVLELPKEGKTLILGGAKIDTKFPVIKNFIDKAENILIGGAIANVFLASRGIDIKKSLTDDNFLEDALDLLKEKNIIIPDDYIISDDMILDIGEKTTDKFVEIINKSKLVIWNGPLGKAEIPEFSHSSEKIAKFIVDSGAFSVVGGGDTIAFLEDRGLINKFNYVSTGGGAMLEFFAGNKLPGLEALDYYSA
ncbi:MAG: phosphoglycerate kinase [Candidatus Azambacteria bacterium]|nr:phosphoglycerate kinase [Candidatus Azambacteria bacterium]